MAKKLRELRGYREGDAISSAVKLTDDVGNTKKEFRSAGNAYM